MSSTTHTSFIQNVNNIAFLSPEQKNALISQYIKQLRYDQLKSFGHPDHLIGFDKPVPVFMNNIEQNI